MPVFQLLVNTFYDNCGVQQSVASVAVAFDDRQMAEDAIKMIEKDYTLMEGVTVVVTRLYK